MADMAEDAETLRDLTTESANASATALDTKSALEIAAIINAEDRTVPIAIATALPQIARVIEAAATAIAHGGRLIYVGAGTSGRLGALDASECPPTFGVNYETVEYVMAGGTAALAAASEASEDSRALGIHDIGERDPAAKDLVIGIAASGRTPYTLAAVEYAHKAGATTACIACNLNSPLAAAVDLPIEIEVGAEVISGSTRMKAGTAHKLVLNMISTGAFTRLGFIYDNLMVNVQLKNEKLVARATAILERICAVDSATAEHTLAAAGRHLPTAIVMLKRGLGAGSARQRLAAAHGNVRRALEDSKPI